MILLSQQALLASDGPPPRGRSTDTSTTQAPRFFIGRDSRSTSEKTSTVATADVKESTHVTTSRGSKRNTKLQWRSVRGPSHSTVQPTAHNDGPAPSHQSNSVLKNASAAPLPVLDPLEDPFGDRLAAQPDFEDDNAGSSPGPLEAPSSEDEFVPPTLEDTPPSTRTPSTDQVDPFGGQPEAEANELPEPKQPETFRADEPTDDLTPPRELSEPTRPLSREEQLDKDYRNDLALECEEGLQELRIKTLAAVDLHERLDIAEKGTALKDFPISCPVDTSELEPRHWDEMYIAWTASGLCHKPLYFEERHLERYGHSTGPYTQPVVSMAHFFGSLAVLPYNMGLKTPDECVYALGHYRPGSCAPYMVRAVPFTARAALFQAGAVVGAAAVLP